MTLLGSEHSMLIRSKFRSVLQLRLQQRQSREQLANQGVMPPLKTPSAFHEQKKTLERAKSEHYLKHKIRNKPAHAELVDMHILQDSATEGSIQATQMKLKRAHLADNLNEKIALRPGPLELVEKNIIPVDSAVKEAIKDTQVTFSKSSDAFAFEEDSSNDGMSPEQARSEDSEGSTESAAGTNISETVFPSMSGSAQSKSSSDSKNRHKKPKESKPKVKKLKYHQYIPPDQKAEKSPPPMDSAYARLLQQQQLFLQLQILSQQQQHQHHQHFSYSGSHSSQLKQSNAQVVKTANSSPTAAANSSLSPVKGTFSGQPCISALKPGPLPSNLDDLKVSELRQQLRIRGLPVSGTKTALMERLRPFQECGGGSVPSFSEITTVTFPVTPTSSLCSYQSRSSASLLSNGFYHFGSTSSTPPISPASSDLSVNGSLPDTFNEGPMSSPQFVLHPSPVQSGCEESFIGSINGAGIQLDVERVDTEKDKMLVEKQKVINELTWKLQQEQRQVEELRMQLQKRKRSHGVEEKQTSEHFFAFSIKQENTVSSCPFASKQTVLKGQTSSSDTLTNCELPQLPCLPNTHCMDSSRQNGILSSTLLSPQCSPQHSPLETAKSPQHISLPPSPNSHYVLSVSPNTQGEGRSSSPQANSHLHSTPMPTQGGQKYSILSPSFCKSNIALPEGKPPPYADAVKQQMTRSQQMDELLDVLIETGEMPANAKDDRPCLQKMPQITMSSGSSGTSSLLKASSAFEQGPSSQLSFEHGPGNNENHLEILLNSHSPLGRTNEIALLKVGGEEPHFEGVMEGFSSKTADDLLTPHEILPTPLSPMETQLSPSDEGSDLHMSFTESPWETMEWLDLTPPSSANAFGPLTTTGPSIFNIDFLDVTDLNLNSTMDLQLQQW
ncbi:myocardin [Heteronotia binoei]|uniref:myocardin n=1 Tax=Heteronotia binoei TaxID=13085 RepID=UPI00292E428F|nr:myocardin [Heteronotia binoei]